MDNLRCWVRHVVEITKHAPSLVISSDEQPGGLFVSSATGELLWRWWAMSCSPCHFVGVVEWFPVLLGLRCPVFAVLSTQPLNCHFERSERSECSREILLVAFSSSKQKISPLASLGRNDSKQSNSRNGNSPTHGMETVRLTEWKQSDSRNGNGPTHGMETVQLTEYDASIALIAKERHACKPILAAGRRRHAYP